MTVEMLVNFDKNCAMVVVVVTSGSGRIDALLQNLRHRVVVRQLRLVNSRPLTTAVKVVIVITK